MNGIKKLLAAIGQWIKDKNGVAFHETILFNAQPYPNQSEAVYRYFNAVNELVGCIRRTDIDCNMKPRIRRAIQEVATTIFLREPSQAFWKRYAEEEDEIQWQTNQLDCLLLRPLYIPLVHRLELPHDVRKLITTFL